MFKEFMIKDISKMMHGKTGDGSLELIRGVSINSKEIKPGDLFFALKGEHTDGHLFVKEALSNGASAVVVEKSQKVGDEILVSDTLFALGELARKYRSLFHPTTIAITGTNGKTTTKNLISAIFKKKYNTLATKKNYNSLIGLPLTIFELSGDEDYLIVEIGTSNPGEIKRLCEIAQPDSGVVTNIGPGHLESFGSINGVKEEKLSLVKALPEGGFALLGEGLEDVKGKNIFNFSLEMADDISLTEKGSYFTYKNKEFFTNLLGLGNVYNCLCAVCLTSHFNIEYDFQRAALAEIKPESGRMEPIHCNDLLIINDTYNANPVSMKSAIDFTSVVERRRIFILGDMLELGRDSRLLHKNIGVYARKHCELLLTFGEQARHYKGVHFTDKRKLVRYLVDNLEGDELILVKASRGLHFEDIVFELLREL
ncbi:MAG TPA: UDP-N-acetylmuramoyl-tripeptide--D-alanyl-D-alanine ligase [candidate division WOR-3 bacterium]|uniref:UDP-N-acetylmuramoyl-tripeptide--D-alanyl-D-alanine ligase n=1 Tax=candidate division WOR-3 bacterium TaxID=2052148 RepID=A0A9C9EN61_UNCW3|nr:UDP-N-acetylmuramoyl-tripeptide--D-alanyl-D-alanine ligase [candidate division WOR-3 bacterium]